jgi:hypothetical protein
MTAPRVWVVAALVLATACARPYQLPRDRDPNAPAVPDPPEATPGTTGDVPQVPPVVAP